MLRKYASLEVLESWRVPARTGMQKAAHRVAFDYEPRPGYLYVRSRMISSRTNDNHDTFPPGEIEKGYRTFLGKPVFVNHHNANHRRARGVIVAVALHRDRNPDNSPDTWVEGLMEVDALRFPRLAQAIISGRVNRTSMGVDVEWSTCSACGNRATSPAEYCKHLPALKGKKIRKRNQVTGKVEEKLIHEVCAGLSFFENSLLVEDPADPTAYVVGNVDTRGLSKAAARKTASGPDFRDHIQNPCTTCGMPVKYSPRRGFSHDTPRLIDHPAQPADPGDKSGSKNYTYGGTHCLACGEPVRVNLRALDTATGGWHHHDGMKRDHPALPADEQAVYDSIPGASAARDQARMHVREHLQRQFEQLGGGPVTMRRGDEDQMPPDPFLASLRQGAGPAKGGDHPFFRANPVSRQNIVNAWNDTTDDEKALGSRWYSDAHHVAKAISGGDAAQGAGVLSAYSVRTNWPVNMFNASRAFQGDPPGPGSGAMAVHQKPAMEIIAGKHWSQALNGPKTRAFAHLIEHGGDTPEDEAAGTHKVVIDRHATSVAMGRRISDGNKAPLGQPQHYEHVAQLYRDAAKDISRASGRKVSPHQVQAATWLGQIRKNQAQDAAGPGGGGNKGQVTRSDNAKATWRQHHPEAHPGGIPEENMHHRGAWQERADYCTSCGYPVAPVSDVDAGRAANAFPRSSMYPHLCAGCAAPQSAEFQPGFRDGGMPSSRPWNRSDMLRQSESAASRLAYGETRVPSQVDTLRMEECPVCGESDVWSGDRCPVCFTGEVLIRTRAGYIPIASIEPGEEVLSSDGRWHKVLEVMERDYDGAVYELRSSMMASPVRVTPEHPIGTLVSHHPLGGTCTPGRCAEGKDREKRRSRKGQAGIRASWQQAEEIRSRYATGGVRQKALAAEYGISQMTVSLITQGKILTSPERPNTPKHHIGWKEAKNLGLSDFAVSKVLDETAAVPASSVEVPPEYLDRRRNGGGVQRKGPPQFELTDDFLWAVGLYLAEGSSSARHINFALHEKEVEHRDRLVRLFEGYGYKTAVLARDGHRGMWIEVYSSVLAEWLPAWLGHGSHNKAIPAELLNLPIDRLEHVWRGVLDGDGSNGYDRIKQTSEILALQLAEIALRRGGVPTINSYEGYQGRKRTYAVLGTTHSRLGTRNEMNKRGTWKFLGETLAQVRNVRSVPYAGKVYNLRVEGDPTYVVQNMLVHNCGFIVPPSLFRDPDVTKAQQVRDELDQEGEVVTQGTPGDPSTQEIGSGEDAGDQMTHPDQAAPDGTPGTLEGGPVSPADTDGQPPEEDEDEGEVPPGVADEEVQGEEEEGQGAQEQAEGEAMEEGAEEEQQGLQPDLMCPACGAAFSTDMAAQPGTPCPACRMGSLEPVSGPRKDQEDPGAAEADDEEEDEGDDMPPTTKTAAALARVQAHRIAVLTAENEAMAAQLSFLAQAAGVDRQLAQIRQNVLRRHADLLNPASPVPDPPQAPATETTEQALQPAAMDDPSRPGSTPGANAGVPAQMTTTSITPGVEMQTPPASQLIDVTAPVQGTNPSQDGGVPIEQRRIETDVRVDPDPLKAHGPGIGGQGDNGTAFPWMLDAQPQQASQRHGAVGRDSSAAVGAYGEAVAQGVTAAAMHGGSYLDAPNEAASANRTFASIRLAKLRIATGSVNGDELTVAAAIEQDQRMPISLIEHEIGVLSRMPGRQPQAPRPMQRAAARSAPSLASVGGSAYYAPAAMDDLDGSDLFL